MQNTNNFNWIGAFLYDGKKDTKYSVVFWEGPMIPQDVEGKLYKIKYPDEILSEDYYNLTRAKEHCISEYSTGIRSRRNGARKPVDAFK